MRRLWNGLVFVSALLFILAGCATPDHLKPPKPAECYKDPPDEKRFEQPPEIAKKYLMEESAGKDFDLTAPDATAKKNAGPGSMRAGGGGGGPGY